MIKLEELSKMSKLEELEDLCESAWGIIANAYGGDWELANNDWQNAAQRWRDHWNKMLPKTRPIEEKIDEEI